MYTLVWLKFSYRDGWEDGDTGSARQPMRDVTCLHLCVPTRGSSKEQSQNVTDKL